MMRKKKVLEKTKFEVMNFIFWISILKLSESHWMGYIFWGLALTAHILYVIGSRHNEEVVDLNEELDKKLDIEDVINHIRNEDRINLN